MAGRTRLHSDVVFGGETTDDISFRNPKKRILFEDDSCKADVDLTEHMKCYLRIRPFAEGEVSNNEDQVFINNNFMGVYGDQELKNPLVGDRRFVGSDLTFSNPVKTDGPVATVQLRT
jgi:hypothetical protein